MMHDDRSEPTIAATPSPDPAAMPLVVFGRDADGRGKPHASVFTAEEAVMAEKAAGLMGMRVLRLATEDDAALAVGLAKGKIFVSGLAFVPFCGAAAFARLDAAPNAFSPARPAEADSPKAATKAKGRPPGTKATNTAKHPAEAASAPVPQPGDWDSIAVGSTVLAAEEDAPAVWYVATVVAQRGDDIFTLRWKGSAYANEPTIVRRRDHLALMPPHLAAVIMAD